jgi:putative Holliday junction resolvase
LRAGVRLAVDAGSARIGVARCDPGGLPTGLSGREGAAAGEARAFAASLAGRLAPVPVRLLDERLTTVIAHDALRQAGHGGRARRPVVDQAAAALILQGALDAERATGRPAGELVGSAPGAG